MKTFQTTAEAFEYAANNIVLNIVIGDVVTVYEQGDLPSNIQQPTLDELKEFAKQRIDNCAECCRSLEITTLPGQTMEYSYTKNEARKFLASNDTDFTNYPYLMAEKRALDATGQGITSRQIAELVVYEASAYGMFGAAIKYPRRMAKMLIDEAASAEEIYQIEENIQWPTLY